MPRNRLIFIAVIVGVVLWRAGTFDSWLSQSGLNAKPCGVTAIGTTVCGRQYESIRAVQSQAEAAQRLREGREAQESREEQARAREELIIAGAEERERAAEAEEAEAR